MRAFIDIQQPLPGSIGYSYGAFGFYKFGVFCWTYGNYDGPVYWINTQHRVINSEYPGANGYRAWFAPGVVALVTITPTVRSDIPDVQIDGVDYNPNTGKNMPLVLKE